MNRYDFFANLPENEPNSATFTSAYLTPISIKATDTLLDLACAAGSRATWVARSRCCKIVACDTDERYLKHVERRASDGGAGHLVTAKAVSSYTELPFEPHQFKVVIAESAAWGIGLQKAINAWRDLITPDGYLAIAYPGIVNKDAPKEVRAPLEERMAEPMATLAEYHAIIRSEHFEIAHQVPLLPEIWDRFYTDVLRHAWALQAQGGEYENDPLLKSLCAEAQWYKRLAHGRIFLEAMVLRPAAEK